MSDTPPIRHHTFHHTKQCRYSHSDTQETSNNRCSTQSTRCQTLADKPSVFEPPTPGRQPKLLRKEVIQPHLPVRLPCYDLVPIASPTFDGSLHKGWATGFGCYRLS